MYIDVTNMQTQLFVILIKWIPWWPYRETRTETFRTLRSLMSKWANRYMLLLLLLLLMLMINIAQNLRIRTSRKKKNAYRPNAFQRNRMVRRFEEAKEVWMSGWNNIWCSDNQMKQKMIFSVLTQWFANNKKNNKNHIKCFRPNDLWTIRRRTTMPAAIIMITRTRRKQQKMLWISKLSLTELLIVFEGFAKSSSTGSLNHFCQNRWNVFDRTDKIVFDEITEPLRQNRRIVFDRITESSSMELLLSHLWPNCFQRSSKRRTGSAKVKGTGPSRLRGRSKRWSDLANRWNWTTLSSATKQWTGSTKVKGTGSAKVKATIAKHDSKRWSPKRCLWKLLTMKKIGTWPDAMQTGIR